MHLDPSLPPLRPRSARRLCAGLLLTGVYAVFTATGPAGAEELTLALDPERTRITFTLGATLHTVEGSFRLERGAIRFDLEDGSASGELVVDATSGDTGNDGRDRDMHAKVLDSETYPDFVFEPSAVSGSLDASGSGEVTVIGELTVHGDTHRVEIPATVQRQGDTLRAAGSLTVPYVAWGMTDPSKFVLRVDKSVEVTFEAVGTLSSSVSR